MIHPHPRRRAMAASTIGLAVQVLLSVAGGARAAAQSLPPQPANGLPNVPTTRVLAIGHLTAKSTPAAMREIMPDEVRATVQLYLSGKVAEWYVRRDIPGVVFVLDVRDTTEAHALLEALPLGKASLMDFQLIPLGPLAPLGLLTTKP